MEVVNIEDVLEDGKIRFRTWREYTHAQRRYVLNEIVDENYSLEILNLIAPQLRVGNLPEDGVVIQNMYMTHNPQLFLRRELPGDHRVFVSI